MLNLDQVIALAVTKHAGQVRKSSGLPYITHPIEVLKLISNWGIRDDTMWMAAVCHDMLEDTNITGQELAKSIGDAISIVIELTKPIMTDKSEYMGSFASKSVEALVIKIADRICNTRDFASIDVLYAKKYWNKAEALFIVYSNRRNEVRDMFGESICENIDMNICATDEVVKETV